MGDFTMTLTRKVGKSKFTFFGFLAIAPANESIKVQIIIFNNVLGELGNGRSLSGWKRASATAQFGLSHRLSQMDPHFRMWQDILTGRYRLQLWS